MSALARFHVLALVIIVATSAQALYRPQGFSFLGPSGRFVTRQTPVVFSFNNPRDSSGVIRIRNAKSRIVATLTISPGDTSERWNGRDGNTMVAAGVYIYEISIEGRSYSGTVTVLQ